MITTTRQDQAPTPLGLNTMPTADGRRAVTLSAPRAMFRQTSFIYDSEQQYRYSRHPFGEWR
jgi:hypothetical protein